MNPFGWLAIFRLGLVQAALGAIVVLTTSTLNRVMVVELSLPALLPGTEALDAAVSGAAESVGAAVGGLIDVTTRQVDQVSAWTRRDH